MRGVDAAIAAVRAEQAVPRARVLIRRDDSGGHRVVDDRGPRFGAPRALLGLDEGRQGDDARRNAGDFYVAPEAVCPWYRCPREYRRQWAIAIHLSCVMRLGMLPPFTANILRSTVVVAESLCSCRDQS
jgi:hypothetical protein